MAIVYGEKKPIREEFIPTTDNIKTALLMHYRFKRQSLVCTEYDYKDIFVINPKNKTMTEIEIKVSISDLRADFKKDHRIDLIALENGVTERPYYNKGGKVGNFRQIRPQIIDMIYYALPIGLIDKASNIIQEKIPFAGIISIPNSYRYFSDGSISLPKPTVIKRAKRLRKQKNDKNYNQILMDMAFRMSSDIANLHHKLDMLNG